MIVGCSKPIEESTLIKKVGLMYLPDSDKLYTGEVFTNYNTGEKLYQGTYENGLLIDYSYFNKDGSVKEPINWVTELINRDGIYHTQDTNEPYSGPVFSLDILGRKKVESILIDGKSTSAKEFEWHKNGQMKEENTYSSNGKLNGYRTWWYESGQMGQKVWIENGEREKEGTDTRWYSNGQMWYEKHYKDGLLYGKSISFYENGQKIHEASYNDGSVVSKKFWNEDGTLKYQVNYEEEQKNEEIISKKGWEIHKKRYTNGQKSHEVVMKNGIKDGLETSWQKDGRKSFEGTYKNGKEDGLFTWWDVLGNKSTEGTYKNGKEDGLWTWWWYDHGTKKSEITYKDGSIVSRKDWNKDGSLKE